MKCFLDFTEKRIDCAKAEEWLKTTPNSECALNALAIGNPVEYARLYLDGTMQICIDAEDSLELWQIILKLSRQSPRSRASTDFGSLLRVNSKQAPNDL